jgi:NADH dehydrogenase (ubiquinone) 1 alpha subcomplex subunit 5
MFLKRFGGPLLSKVKESTGITGLPVVPNAREVLIGLYNKTLDVVQIIPETAQYRKTVEEISRQRLKVVEESKDWEEIEAKLQAGQVEQIIEQAKDELHLIPKMAGGYTSTYPEFCLSGTFSLSRFPCHLLDSAH